MKKGVKWLSSKCVSLVLVELAKKPLTPMQLRIITGMTKNNYVNIILRRLEFEIHVLEKIFVSQNISYASDGSWLKISNYRLPQSERNNRDGFIFILTK